MKKKPSSRATKAKKTSLPEAEQFEDSLSKLSAKADEAGFLVASHSTPEQDTYVLMPKDVAKYHGDPSDHEKKAYANIRERFASDFEWLMKKALAGESSAIQMIAEFGIDAVEGLNGLIELRPEAVKKVARTFPDWPMLISALPNHPQNAKTLRDQIELGSAIVVREDKVLHKKKPLLQREVVLHVLSIFQRLRCRVASIERADCLRKVLGQFFQVDTSEHISADNDATLAIHAAVLNGEIRKADELAESSQAAIKLHKNTLTALLKFSPEAKVKATPAISKILVRACEIPEPSPSSKDEWFTLTVDFLVALTGNTLEENEALRNLGDSRGDVEIRKLLDKESEFAKRKPEFRHNATVNDAIGRRIKEKLKDAFDALVAKG